VVLHEAENLMNSINLATCIGPSLLRAPDENPIQLISDTPRICSVFVTIIDDYDIFLKRVDTTLLPEKNEVSQVCPKSRVQFGSSSEIPPKKYQEPEDMAQTRSRAPSLVAANPILHEQLSSTYHAHRKKSITRMEQVRRRIELSDEEYKQKISNIAEKIQSGDIQIPEQVVTEEAGEEDVADIINTENVETKQSSWLLHMIGWKKRNSDKNKSKINT